MCDGSALTAFSYKKFKLYISRKSEKKNSISPARLCLACEPATVCILVKRTGSLPPHIHGHFKVKEGFVWHTALYGQKCCASMDVCFAVQ